MSALNLCYPLRSHLPNVWFYIDIYFVQPYTHCLGRASSSLIFLAWSTCLTCLTTSAKCLVLHWYLFRPAIQALSWKSFFFFNFLGLEYVFDLLYEAFIISTCWFISSCPLNSAGLLFVLSWGLGPFAIRCTTNRRKVVSLVAISADFSNGWTPVLLTMVVTTKITLSLCLATSLSMVYFLMPASSTELWLKGWYGCFNSAYYLCFWLFRFHICHLTFTILHWPVSVRNWVKFHSLQMVFFIRVLLSVVWIMCSRILSSCVLPNSQSCAFSSSRVAYAMIVSSGFGCSLRNKYREWCLFFLGR